MTRKGRRMWLFGLGLGGVGAAVGLALGALQDNVTFFFSPSDLETKAPPANREIRVGGLVAEGSVLHIEGSATTRFTVTDGAADLIVEFVGQLPALFREGQGVVAQGELGDAGVFKASEVLAKHDENYMPPEVADALKRSGHFKDGAEDGG